VYMAKVYVRSNGIGKYIDKKEVDRYEKLGFEVVDRPVDTPKPKKSDDVVEIKSKKGT